MDDVERICDWCGIDQTPLGKGISMVNNSHGYSIGLFCENCAVIARDVVDRVARIHGAYISPDGTYRSSPKGTPDLRSLRELLDYLEPRERAIKARNETSVRQNLADVEKHLAHLKAWMVAPCTDLETMEVMRDRVKSAHELVVETQMLLNWFLPRVPSEAV